MSKNILVVGSLNMDLTVMMERLPCKGETILGKKITYGYGGKGANQACACAKLGGNTTMLGCVGNDDFGKELIKNLKDNGVSTEFIKEVDGTNTGTAIIHLSDKGENHIVVIPGANYDCDVEYLKSQDACFERCDIVLVQMEIPLDAIQYTIKRAKELGKIVVLNPAPACELDKEIYKGVDYITPNETELASLVSCDCSFEEKIEKLLKNEVKNVLVTMGENGVYYCGDKNQKFTQPAYKVNAIDTVAAGDCFNGAFCVCLTEEKSIEESLKFSNAASAIAVTRRGAQDSIPTRCEVEQFIKERSA